ncbi:DNA ligase 3-like isoform X1 [Haliotis rubra]|uniref:DNA ligase 3-like isoform X1 n=1 Tax=Haliotis rubra TaxID=36100 RepID=UPI001EE55EE1|nr:DNA ligase 3-like isoform X1 [Haliotis rubra]XP_046572184.1 DNA ligase 3-like isoform X1 [Haliotis rubra]
MTEIIFYLSRATSGRSICRNCNKFIQKDMLRIGKRVPNPRDVDDEGWGDITLYHHVACMFKMFEKETGNAKKIKSPDDMFGFDELKKDEKKNLLKLISDANIKREDNSLHQFRCLCTKISEEDSDTGKTALVSDYLKKGTSGSGFKGDVYMLMKFLLTGIGNTWNSLNDKVLVNLFSQIFGTSQKAMEEDLAQTEVWEIIRVCFEKSKTVMPPEESTLSLREMRGFLNVLTPASELLTILKKLVNRCTSNDLMMVVRLIKNNIGINAEAKTILDALDRNAYEAFQISEDLEDVVDRVQSKTLHSLPGMKKKMKEKTKKNTEHGAKQSSSDAGASKKKTPVKRQARDEGQTTPSKKCKTARSSPSMCKIFTDCKIFLSVTTDKFKELKQYIIDFDGEVLDESRKRSATHIVSSKGRIRTGSSKAKVVTPDWLWQSIKKKQLASTEEFKP